MATTKTTTTPGNKPGNQRGFNYLGDAITTMKSGPVAASERAAATRTVHAYAARTGADATELLAMLALDTEAVAA